MLVRTAKTALRPVLSAISLAISDKLVYCPVLNVHIRVPQMVHSKARLAGNGEYPCQELQRGGGPFVGLPSGEALSGRLRCCIGLT